MTVGRSFNVESHAPASIGEQLHDQRIVVGDQHSRRLFSTMRLHLSFVHPLRRLLTVAFRLDASPHALERRPDPARGAPAAVFQDDSLLEGGCGVADFIKTENPASPRQSVSNAPDASQRRRDRRSILERRPVPDERDNITIDALQEFGFASPQDGPRGARRAHAPTLRAHRIERLRNHADGTRASEADRARDSGRAPS